MTVFVVTYDLNQRGQNYECITSRIEALTHFHAQKSVWFVEYEGDSMALASYLIDCLDDNDRLFVTPIDGWAGVNMPKGEKWLNEHA